MTALSHQLRDVQRENLRQMEELYDVRRESVRLKQRLLTAHRHILHLQQRRRLQMAKYNKRQEMCMTLQHRVTQLELTLQQPVISYDEADASFTQVCLCCPCVF